MRRSPTIYAVILSIWVMPLAASAQEAATGLKGVCHKVVAAAAGTAGACVGVGIGVPVSTCRFIARETRRMTGTIRDDLGAGLSFWDPLISTALGVPYGIASGTMLGLVKGTERGFKVGFSKPFSSESIGLGDESDFSIAQYPRQ